MIHQQAITEAFSNDLHYFSNKLTELGFIRRKAASDILTMVGVGSEGRGDKLLDLVTASFHTSHDPRKWFGELFSHEAAYVYLATSIYDCMSIIIDTAKTMVLTQHIFHTHHPVLHYSHTHIPLTDLLCHHR